MSKKNGTLIIEGGLLIDGTGQKPIEDAVIVVEKGRIKAVDKEDQSSISNKTDKTKIDASGMTVMPGLIDSHLHLLGLKTNRHLEETLRRPLQLGLIKSVYDAVDLLEAGFTTVKDCGGFGIYLKKAIAEGTIHGPRILAAGYALSQTAGHADPLFLPLEWVSEIATKRGKTWWDMTILCDGVPECIKAARCVLREGADFIKVMASGGVMSMGDRPEETQFTMEELRAIVEEARHAQKFVTAHCIGTESIKNCVAAGVKTIDHASYPDDEVIEMARKKDVVFVSTLSILQRIITEGEKAGYNPVTVAKGKEVSENAARNIAKLYSAGLTVASASDFVGSPLLKMGANATELELLVKQCGFKPMDAIVAATQNGAKACGLETQVGTIEEGKLGDIIIVDGDPIRDIRVLQDKNKIKLVMKEGEIEVNRLQ